MADIRIKDLATTASSTAADDFLAVDGTTNGTRKLSAATPSFATSVTVPGVAGPTATDLTLAGGSTGASLVLGQGASGYAKIVRNSDGNNIPGLQVKDSATGYSSIGIYSGASDNVFLGLQANSISSSTKLVTYPAYPLDIWINNTPTARFATTGNLLIGTTTDGGQKLQVNGTANFAGAVTAGGKITSSVSTATGYNQLYDTTGITTGRGAFAITSTGAGLAFGVEASVGGTSFTGSTAYASYFGTTTATPIHFVTNSVIRQTIDSTGAATFAGAVTVNSSIVAGTGSLSLNGASGNGVNIHNTLTSGVSIGAVPTVVGILSVRPVADGIFNFRNASGLGSYTGGAIDMLNDASNTVTNLTIRAAETNFIGVGATKIASTTPSTGAGSGALQVAGGIYAGANSYFGGSVSLVNASDSNMSLTRTGGVALALSSRASSAVVGSGGTLVLESSNTTALTFDSSQNATFSGDIKFSLANSFDIGQTGTRVRTAFVKTLVLTSGAPATASSVGAAGTLTWDANYIYVCTATDTWKRVAIATW